MEKKYYTPNELARELENIVADKDKLNTKSDISDWLARLYVAAAKLTIIQKTCREQQFAGADGDTVKRFLADFPSHMVLLHGLAEEALGMLEGK